MDASHIPLGDEHRMMLSRIIETVKRYNEGYIFAEPVDYIQLGIPDYPKVIRQPMDLSTLKKNLYTYKFLGDFLKDSELIWSNCRTYNGQAQDGFYIRASTDCEKYFVNQIIKIKELGLTMALYKKIIGKEEVQNEEQEEEYNVSNIQNLIKKLSEIPEVYMMECLKWFCDAKGLTVDFDVPQFQLMFSVDDAKLLRSLEQMVIKKIQEIKESKAKKNNKK
ncbi:Bromodomain-containing_protein [Hexamita inflata]|uniref:Bromodomain-containing protein n=1 Tax=Hexamita inflata TaxID=28002 RepID=A0AA86UJS9_9EUKA|nr:Bromodomain-containing protein [Hexamita inflata]CAI9961135.1 Bromodomain-containing protein [Hexamita inflata]